MFMRTLRCECATRPDRYNAKMVYNAEKMTLCCDPV